MISFSARQTDEGKRIYDLLLEVYPDVAEKELAAAFKKRLITLNGEVVRVKDEVRAGDEICVYLTGDALGISLKPDIVYQDENIVIADKPAGLASISETGPSASSMIEDMMKRRGEYNLSALMVPYIIYPLEKYVSGLMIFAKHESVYLFLAEALAQRRITRYFVCPVAGEAKEKAELLAYHYHERSKPSVKILSNHRKDAKPIVTRYKTLSSGGGLSLLYARPITNYLHQVRAHLAFEGLSVIGDEIYGDKRVNRKYAADNIALWLNTLVFETGTSHEYAYLNGKRFESENQSFPKCVYDAGLF